MENTLCKFLEILKTQVLISGTSHFNKSIQIITKQGNNFYYKDGF